jgi:hypothetical protein
MSPRAPRPELRLRPLLMGLSTVLGAPLLGLRRQGFFIPHRYAESCKPPATYAALEPVLASAAPTFRALIDAAAGHLETLSAFGTEKPPAPRWEQDWFPRLDGAAAYVLTRERKPARIVEIGSGHSTRFFARAIADGGLATRHVAIDPQPRAQLTGLPVEWVRVPLQQAPGDAFAGLRAGDFLFVDSSHILMPGSDVDLILGDVLPRLPAGVLVHFHDIFLPDGYPDVWAWRGYNEQGAVAVLLTGGVFRPVWSSHYAATRMPAVLARAGLDRLPLPAGAFEASLWLERV